MEIEGTIENIIFRNDSNGYTVLQVRSGKTVFTLIGNITKVNVGEVINATTEEVEHPQFGLQYKISRYNIVIPKNDESAIEKFILSLSVKGVGEVTVKRLLANFRTDLIDVIKNDPFKLMGIKGITEARLNELKEKVIERENEIELILALEKYDIGQVAIKKIIEKYGSITLDVINENPYKLAIDIEGIGFKICDKIAKINGFNKDNDKRIMAGILYVLEMNYASGNVFVYRNVLEDEAIRLLEIGGDYNFDDEFYNLEIDLKIKRENVDNKELIFLKSAYNVEKRLSELLYKKKDSINIVTGGPGTGKTYNIKKYLNDASELGIKIALCAPTGRAAKRITEVTGYEAKTIHRLLEFVGNEDGMKSYFQKNENNMLDIDLLIVDEMSMVDEYLMLALIKATPDKANIVLVGDVDQLPSVGAGQVLKDMIESNVFTVNKLTKIHRQDEGSNIVINAHKVNNGDEVTFEKGSEDFIFTHKSSEHNIKETIKTLVKENLPRHFKVSMDQIQVICPSKKGSCGTEELNVILQDVLNPESFEKDEIKVGDTVFRVGDKVMQTANNYNIPYDMVSSDGKIYDRGVGIFNGDIGEILEIDDETRNMVIKYDDREAFYVSKDLIDLSLAYAITVHKSQGSEYDVVVMPMYRAPIKLLNRKILYTAMTRAKKCIIFVGIEEYFNEMIKNINEAERNSALCSKLYYYDLR